MTPSHAKTRVIDNADSPARTFYDEDIDFPLLNEIHKASRQYEYTETTEEVEEEDMEKVNVV